MKFTVSKNDFLAAIHTAGRATSSKSTMPALEGLLLSAEGSLSVTGYDLEMGISCICPAEIEQPGALIIPFRLLSDLIRRFSADTVELSTDDNCVCTLTCGSSTAELVGIPADDFPSLPVVQAEQQITLSSELLRSMIVQTVFAVSPSETKPVYTGSLFDVVDDTLYVVSVDGFRLSLRKENISHTNETRSFRFNIPGNTLREVEKILGSEDPSDVVISLAPRHVCLSLCNTTIISRLIDGEFYKYENNLAASNPVKVTLNLEDFIDNVEMVSLLISEKYKNGVRCKFDGNIVQMSTVSASGKIVTECAVDGGDCDLEIGFSNRYLLEALKSIDDETAIIELNTAMSPCYIRPADGDKFFHLIMPVRLNANADA